MARERTGYIYQDNDKRWWARVTFVDDHGRRHYFRRLGENKTDARRIKKELLQDIEKQGEKIVEAGRMTFLELTDRYKSTYLVPPIYEGSRKVAGLRAYKKFAPLLEVLRDHFGKKRLRSINYADIEAFRMERLATKTIHDSTRSLATVHRELSLLRRVFNVAVRNGWLVNSPFKAGPPLISQTDERPRSRTLTRDEESRLLMACAGGKRAHIRPVVAIALDSGLRRGEILSLVWSDVDFERRTLRVRALNSKTQRERRLGMTPRVDRELKAMRPVNADPEKLVFSFKDFKNGWRGALKEAKITDLRFHDLRSVCATRLAAVLPLAEVGKLLGHSEISTTFRHYVGVDDDLLERAVNVLQPYDTELQDLPERIH